MDGEGYRLLQVRMAEKSVLIIYLGMSRLKGSTLFVNCTGDKYLYISGSIRCFHTSVNQDDGVEDAFSTSQIYHPATRRNNRQAGGWQGSMVSSVICDQSKSKFPTTSSILCELTYSANQSLGLHQLLKAGFERRTVRKITPLCSSPWRGIMNLAE